ncbi:hypothetical protein ACGF0D_30750 [Kitasatospora sp. NPDC048298]|uniref:hypothetical protein n=1 Tax=Kitasatospora sp. NPDC048298 TaxID=3364049 RepID=UPI00371044DD
MPVDQYVYFALSSLHTSAADMAAVLGLEPDEIMVRGSGSHACPGPGDPRLLPQLLARDTACCRCPATHRLTAYRP